MYPIVELEGMINGLIVALVVVFVLPLIVSAFILTAAILNASQGSLPTVLFADNNLRNLLSIAFRISLIPGVAVLVHRAFKSLRYHPRDERLVVILVLLTLLAVFAFAPSQPHLREAITAVGSPHEQVRQIIYKKDGHHTGAAIKNPLGSSRARAFLSAVGFSAIIPRHRNEINIAF